MTPIKQTDSISGRSVLGRWIKVHNVNKERTVPLGSLTQKLLGEYFSACPYESKYVFVSRAGEPMTCDSVKHMITKAAARLPFEFSSHKLRHNFATNYCIDQYTEYIAARMNVSHLDKLALSL